MGMSKYRHRYILVFLTAVLAAAGWSCNNGDDVRLHFERQGRPVPEFNADSAYRFVEAQVAPGPRNPGSPGHSRTRDYLLRKLRDYAGEQYVFAQEFTHTSYDSSRLEMANIIASFNASAPDRIFLCAHWDTRPRADRDSINQDQPIPGADDGASGTAVLLELARIFSEHPLPLGVDVILFDGEDYGKENDLQNYFLGSRYWTQHPPVENYRPRFGILLDMVGGVDARFPKERNSLNYAPALVNEIWSIAGEKGYGDYFVDWEGALISDDHVIINRVLNIPTIDIIRHRRSESGNVIFPPYWHTHSDDLPVISRQTLKATGEVLVELIYNRVQ